VSSTFEVSAPGTSSSAILSPSSSPINGAAAGSTTRSGLTTCCGCYDCYSINAELLDYDYTYDDSNKIPQPLPRHRERGEPYIDTYNDQPWSWTFGTHEQVRLVGLFLIPTSLCQFYSFRKRIWEPTQPHT
jgi:hypothetical protein